MTSPTTRPATSSPAGRGSSLVHMIAAPGQGHSFREGFFHRRPPVDFLIARAQGRPLD